jgi:ABC-type uncharacterized transport system permease subunit
MVFSLSHLFESAIHAPSPLLPALSTSFSFLFRVAVVYAVFSYLITCRSLGFSLQLVEMTEYFSRSHGIRTDTVLWVPKK